MIDGVIGRILPCGCYFYNMHDSSAGDRPEGSRQRADTQPCINRRAALLARKVKKTPGSDRMTDRFGGSIRGEGRYYLKDFHNPVTCTA
jgi:hypothetical protein